LSPRKGLNGLDSGNEVQLLKQHLSALLEIHRVEMESTNANISVQDFATHICHQLSADLANLLVVVLHGLEGVEEALGYGNFSEARCALEAVPRLDRRDSRDNGDGDARFTDSLDPTDEEIDVVEHLREDEADAGVDLFFQPSNLVVTLFLGQSHMLREARNSDVEIVVVLAPYVSHEIDTVHESTGDGLPFFLALWRITAQREYVPAPMLFCVL
jgi:hypothetical protein